MFSNIAFSLVKYARINHQRISVIAFYLVGKFSPNPAQPTPRQNRKRLYSIVRFLVFQVFQSGDYFFLALPGLDTLTAACETGRIGTFL